MVCRCWGLELTIVAMLSPARLHPCLMVLVVVQRCYGARTAQVTERVGDAVRRRQRLAWQLTRRTC